MLLTEATWKRGGASDAYAADVLRAMRAGIKCLVVQEVPGARLGDTEERHACSYEHFLEGEDAVPRALIKAGLLNEKVLELSGDQWRLVGLLRMLQELASGGGERKVLVDESTTSISSAATGAVSALCGRLVL